MTINDLKFKTFIENLPSIKVSLEWEQEEGSIKHEGRAEEEAREMISGSYILFADFNVYESGQVCEGDRMTPSSFTSDGNEEVLDFAFKIFHTETDEEIHLTKHQKQALTNAIKLNIQIN